MILLAKELKLFIHESQNTEKFVCKLKKKLTKSFNQKIETFRNFGILNLKYL